MGENKEDKTSREDCGSRWPKTVAVPKLSQIHLGWSMRGLSVLSVLHPICTADTLTENRHIQHGFLQAKRQASELHKGRETGRKKGIKGEMGRFITETGGVTSAKTVGEFSQFLTIPSIVII